MKQAIWLGMFIGSIVGGFVPLLWGAGALSFSSILFSSVGAAVGIIVAYRLMH